MDSEELEKAYAQASEEVDPAWDVAIADGLSDEAWENPVNFVISDDC